MFRKLLLAASLLVSPAAASAKWREASTDHFVIYSEESEASLRDFATRLERYDGAMRVMRGIPKDSLGPANRLTIYVVSSQAAVGRLANDSGNFVAGFYIPRASGSIAVIPRRIGTGGRFETDPEQILLHEYAHHFLFQNDAGAYPAWFTEGYAEVHSTAKFEKDGSVGIGLPAAHRAYGLMRGNPLPLERLLTHTTGKLSLEQREAIYGRGWLLTHYLMFEPSRSGQLAAYLDAFNRGEGPKAARVFGDLKMLEREINAYMVRRRLSYRQVPAAQVQIGKIAIRDVSPGEDAVMNAKIQSRRGVNAEQARKLLPVMRKAAAPFANDPAVQATLAEAEYDAGYFKEAEAAADRALAADPKSIDALIYKARVKMALARNAGGLEAWREARKWISAANRADPDDPEPLVLFHSSFREQGIPVTANAVTGLNYAHMLAPQDRGLRMTVAHQYLIDGKTKEARATLAPIAYDPHAGEAGQLATAIIAKLDGGTARDALSAWREPSDDEPGTP